MSVRGTTAGFCGLGRRSALIVIFVQSLRLLRVRVMTAVTAVAAVAAVAAVHAEVHPQHAADQ